MSIAERRVLPLAEKTGVATLEGTVGRTRRRVPRGVRSAETAATHWSMGNQQSRSNGSGGDFLRKDPERCDRTPPSPLDDDGIDPRK